MAVTGFILRANLAYRCSHKSTKKNNYWVSSESSDFISFNESETHSKTKKTTHFLIKGTELKSYFQRL